MKRMADSGCLAGFANAATGPPEGNAPRETGQLHHLRAEAIWASSKPSTRTQSNCPKRDWKKTAPWLFRALPALRPAL